MLSSYALKIIALVSMLVDHAAYAIELAGIMEASLPYYLLRAFGRLAFPLYAFLLVIGFEKTKDRARYLTRLCLFAVISQIPYSFALSERNYGSWSCISSFRFRYDAGFLLVLVLLTAALILIGREQELFPLSLSASGACLLSGMRLLIGGWLLIGEDLNVLYTLACSLSFILVLDMIKNRQRHSALTLIAAAAACAAVCVLILGSSDYGYFGLLLVVLLYCFRGRRRLQALMTALWGLVVYMPFGPGGAAYSFAATCLAAGLILVYSGEQGRRSRLFYWAYPAHLAVYGVIFHFLLK